MRVCKILAALLLASCIQAQETNHNGPVQPTRPN